MAKMGFSSFLQVQVRLESSRMAYMCLVPEQNGTATLENSLVVSHKEKHDSDPIKQLSHLSPGIYSNRIKLTLKENLCEICG